MEKYQIFPLLGQFCIFIYCFHNSVVPTTLLQHQSCSGAQGQGCGVRLLDPLPGCSSTTPTAYYPIHQLTDDVLRGSAAV